MKWKYSTLNRHTISEPRLGIYRNAIILCIPIRSSAHTPYLVVIASDKYSTHHTLPTLRRIRRYYACENVKPKSTFNWDVPYLVQLPLILSEVDETHGTGDEAERGEKPDENQPLHLTSKF